MNKIFISIKSKLKPYIPVPLILIRRSVRNRILLLRGYIILWKAKVFRKKQIESYFSQFKIKKLQLGAGANSLPEWLNSEGFAPSSFTHSVEIARDYIYLNICKKFPFEDNSINYIFHEHVIEHLNYLDGQAAMKECFRVLKPGGKIRIATPDLEVFVGLYGGQIRPEQKKFLSEYIRYNSEIWSSDLKYVKDDHAVFVLNHNFRAWGHQFIYDFSSLSNAMKAAGFVNTTRQQPQQSKDPHLSKLEYRKNYVGIFDALIIEGEKPSLY